MAVVRGDLAIVPNKCGWFDVSVNPGTDLNTGAMAVLGGAFNDTNRIAAGYAMDQTGGTITTASGVNFPIQNGSAMGCANLALGNQTNIKSGVSANKCKFISLNNIVLKE